MTTTTAELGNIFGRSARSARSRRVMRRRIMRRAFLADITISDWIALALLAWMLAMVGWSVQLANWGDLPNIVPTAIIAAVIAFFMTRVRFHNNTVLAKFSIPIKTVIFLIAGVIIVFWQSSLNAEGTNPFARSYDAYDRFGLWVDIAINGGVSGDQIPFAMIMMTVTWVTSFIVTLLTFRFNSPWIPAAILGTALLTNLSHRIGLHEQTFYLFMLAAVALFSHLVAVGRINQWRKSGLTFPKEARWIAARDGLILGFVVLIVAAMAPMFTPRSDTLSVRWNTIFLDPFTQFRETAERLLAGVPRGDDNQIYSPNAVLPFQGGIELTDDPVMWIRSRYAKLHPSRVYQEYSSQGWITAPSVSLPADAGTKLLTSPDEIDIDERQRLDISVELLGRTNRVIPAAAVHALDYQAEVEILEPLSWDVPLAGSPAKLAELPEDLREFAFMLRERLMKLATDSPIYSPPDTANDRPPFTLNTQPAMTFDEVSSVIRQMQSNVEPIYNVDEQITFTITESSIEEIGIREDSGELIDMTFTISDASLEQMLHDASGTPQTVGIRVSTAVLREIADLNDGVGPRRLQIIITAQDLLSLAIPDLDPLGSTRPQESTRFRITAENIEQMDLRRSGINWQTFSYRVFAEPDGTNANLMRIARRGPTEQNTVTFDEILEENQRYSVTTYISTAETPELVDSTADYPSWIADRYLQLPETLPTEVRALANQIVSDAAAETPWEKTMAIKAWLQQQVYSLEIEGPGPRDDGIYYFLFKTVNEPCPSELPNCDVTKRKGYSQYYGSAATVMLRSVGVPARMIAGWSAGEYVPDQGQFLIRDRNRHGWTQIFAPPYGWIDIEVTPGRPAVPRNILVPTTPTSEIPPGLPGSAEFDPDYLEYLEDLDELALLEQDLRLGGRFQPAETDQGLLPFEVPVVPTAVATSIILIVLIAVFLWRWNLRGQPASIRAYSQFIRVAALLGYRKPSHVSAREFAAEIADMTMRYADARRIIEAFEKSVYGPTEPLNEATTEPTETAPAEEADETERTQTPQPHQAPTLSQTWRNLARAMLKHRIMTLVGMTPAYIPDEAQEQYRFTT
ncbi:MAG: transglutaminase domain-containing protein [Chloroflexi bacterium]|nr:transglutaminase domain-containing protein [Chloroflexota bacterium]